MLAPLSTFNILLNGFGMNLSIETTGSGCVDVKQQHGLAVRFYDARGLRIVAKVGDRKEDIYEVSLSEKGEVCIDGVCLNKLLWRLYAENRYRALLDDQKMTAAQFVALCDLVVRYENFPNEFHEAVVGCPGVVGVTYANLFIGIEPDGHAHS